MGEIAVVRVLYRHLLRAATRIERHSPPVVEHVQTTEHTSNWSSQASEAAAFIATRAQGLHPAPQVARALERVPPSALVQHAFRGTLPIEAQLGKMPDSTPSVARGDGGGAALASAFEALRSATALAADLELGDALCKATDNEYDADAIEQIERGMWLISARSKAAWADCDESTMSLVETQLETMVSAARDEHTRLARQCTNDGCPFLWVEALNQAVFMHGGFRANRSDYYSPSNSIISEVFQQRTGLPITCGIVYMMVARRLGLTAMIQPTNFPFHFLLRLEPGSTEQCSCVAATQSTCSGGAAKSAQIDGSTASVGTLTSMSLESEWEQVAGLWISVDPETGPELFRLQWAPPPPTAPGTEVEAPASGLSSTRWLIGHRVTHGRMDIPGGGLKPSSAPRPLSLGDGSGGYMHDADTEASGWEHDGNDVIGEMAPPYPPRVRWFKVARPLSDVVPQSSAENSSPGVMVLSASLPDGEEGLEDAEGEFEARLSCRIELHAADKQAQGKIGHGEAVLPGIGRRRLEVTIPESYRRGREGGSEIKGGESLLPRSQPSVVLQLHQVSTLDQFFIDPFCAGQLLPDWYLLHQALSSAAAPNRAELLPLLDRASSRAVISRVLRNLAMAHSQQPNGSDGAQAWSRLADRLK